MTQVDFYLLQDNEPEACSLLACRLTEKAYKKGHRVYIHAESGAQLRQLDELLWSFRAGSFLPHAVVQDRPAEPQPILLGNDSEPQGMDDVLVNLASEVPPFFSRFKRVAELVGGDEAARSAARERYRFYQQRGYTLNTHKL
ncbi:MAG: DNA polymerase III subunit chi [Chromatiales bacterium]|jgi:DNA polymerase-3 subunit chi|nr:MAG: DNA polymerase III subunit chi [Chromatiales bacterium]